MFNRRGSLSIEVLISFVIVSLMCSLIYMSNLVIVKTINKQSDLDLYISIMQVQELLAKAEILEINDTSLNILYFNEEFTLEEKNHRLVKSIGSEILIENIEEVSFRMEEETIYLSFKRNEKNYEYKVGKKEWWRY